MMTTRPERSVARASSTHAAARSWSGARAPCAGRGGSTSGTGSRGADNTSTHAPSSPVTTNASLHAPSNTASRNGRLSSSSLARITPSIGPGGRSARDSTPSGCWSRWAGERSTATYRSAVMHCGRADEHGSGQRARTGPGVDDRERIGTPETVELGVEEAGEDRAEEGADFWRREEVSPSFSGSGVETVLTVEGELHELLERDLGALSLRKSQLSAPRSKGLTDRGRR